MTTWEYQFISLELPYGDDRSPVKEFLQEVAAMGEQGWEAVGPTSVSIARPGMGVTYDTYKYLLFKRPKL